jgi:hypothetical protein
MAACIIQNATLTTTHEHLHAQNDETRGSTEFLQPYPILTDDALLEIGTVVISAVLSLDEHLSQTLLVSRNFVTSRCIVILFGTSLSGFALLKCFTNNKTISERINIRG